MENNQISTLRNTLEKVLVYNEGRGRNVTKLLFSNADVRTILDALALKESTQQNGGCVLKKSTQQNGGCVDPRSRKPFPFMQRELADTAAGMTSPDYKERLRAEYLQTKIRYERLKAFNNKIEAASRVIDNRRYCVNPLIGPGAEVDAMIPKHDCPDDLLREQQSVMGQYLHLLEIRAVIEGVDLGGC